MRLVILHISDIHFKITTSLKPATPVASCLREIPDQIDHVIVVITGDIAFSGKADEYMAFSPFIEQLRVEIKARLKVLLKHSVVRVYRAETDGRLKMWKSQ